MARQRKPLSQAKVEGRTLKDPQRYRNRSDPAVEPLGDPPAWLTKDGKHEWRTLAVEIPWLRKSDRQLVAITAHLAAYIRTHFDAPVSYLAEHRRQLCALGGSPADRSRIYAPQEDDDDPSAEFLN